MDVEALEVVGPPLTLKDPNASYQALLLNEAGMIEASFVNDAFGRPNTAIIRRLTWNGHDFLDSSRDSKLWKMAMEHVIKPGASWSFSVLAEWLKAEAHRRVFGILSSSSVAPPDIV